MYGPMSLTVGGPMLRFDDHVSQICKKASKQLAVLKRIGRF